VDVLEAIGVTLIGLVVRFGIPIVLTILIVMWLRRLDARWQLEANQTRPRAAVAALPQPASHNPANNTPTTGNNDFLFIGRLPSAICKAT